jgi:hypothetical protein
MTEEGQRIEFDDAGPYLFQVFEAEPEAMLLEDHPVCLLRFGGVYLPVALDACLAVAHALANMSQAAMGPEREGMTPVAFEPDEIIELPLLTGAAGESFQHGDVVYLDADFGPTRVRLCFSILAAAVVGQVMSRVAAD